MAHDEAQSGEGLLDEILKAKAARPPVEPEPEPRQSDLVGRLVEDVLRGTIKIGPDLEELIDQRIDAIDAILSDQLNAILHHPDFQKLEGSWRGLHYLVMGTETDRTLVIRVLEVSKQELQRDYDRAKEFDQSFLFGKVYSGRYDEPEGAPYGALIGDFEFGRHPKEVGLLTRIAAVAAAAHAPFIASAAPELFGWESFTELPYSDNLIDIFELPEYDAWRAFRETEDARYVALCLPRMLSRLPYGESTVSVDAFHFEEDVNGRDHDKYLWTSSAYAMGMRLAEAFTNHGWCARIRGVQTGGLVQNLPLHTFLTEDGEIAAKCPVEVIVTGKREKDLADLGFIPLTHCMHTDYAAFFSAPTCHKPAEAEGDQGGARLVTQLPHVLSASRFAHYIETIAWENRESIKSREDCEQRLNHWLVNYLCPDEAAGEKARRQYPLFHHDTNPYVEVVDDHERPGSWLAVATVRPHYQFDDPNDVTPPPAFTMMMHLARVEVE